MPFWLRTIAVSPVLFQMYQEWFQYWSVRVSVPWPVWMVTYPCGLIVYEPNTNTCPALSRSVQWARLMLAAEVLCSFTHSWFRLVLPPRSGPGELYQISLICIRCVAACAA